MVKTGTYTLACAVLTVLSVSCSDTPAPDEAATPPEAASPRSATARITTPIRASISETPRRSRSRLNDTRLTAALSPKA